MAVYGQGAPGVRNKLIDNSEVTLVTNPNITAGIVGYSSRGEFNKIIELTSTADQDTYLGTGYNNAKYNQGLYASRAVLSSGGYSEFVRPYGEANDSTNDVLKTDAFTVAYDYSSGNVDSSFDIHHFASTRIKEDGMISVAEISSGYRRINTITQTLSEHNNVKFEIDADSMTDAAGGTDKVALFAIMNSDPTAANRAGTRVGIKQISDNALTVTVKTNSIHGLSEGDTVYICGTEKFNGTFEVISVTNDKTFTYEITENVNASETDGAVYTNTDDTTTGVDYIQVKTVASGKASKKYDYVTLDSSITTSDAGKTFTMETSTGADATFELTTDGNASDDSYYAITIVSDTYTSGSVADTTKFSVGDKVVISGTVYTVETVNSDTIDLSGTPSNGSIINLTGTLRSFVEALDNAGLADSSDAEATVTAFTEDGTITLDTAEASDFTVNDMIIFNDYYAADGTSVSLPSGLTAGTVYKVNSINLVSNSITVKDFTSGTQITFGSIPEDAVTFKIINLTTGVASATINDNGVSLDIIGTFGLTSPVSIQETVASFFTFDDVSSILSSTKKLLDEDHIISETDGYILLDSDVGRQFLNLGLATEDYQDTDFDGEDERVYQLTDDGEVVARMYLYVTYYFDDETYEFSGTLMQYAYGDNNLYIKNSADDVANGWQLILNDNESLESAIADSNFSLADSVSNGVVTSEFSMVAFDSKDPAIVEDTIWTYSPKNVTSATLASAWNLFLDKDQSSADMFIAAGTAITNLFVKHSETINYTVMDEILEICEKRKDCFAIFDGVDESNIDTALKKMVGIGSDGDLARWGAIFDGRSIFTDSNYTKLNVEAVKSIEVAAIITLNRSGNVYWLPPAGYATGSIPSKYAKSQKFPRTYNYAADADSDIARLYDANINPTRVNSLGQYIYGQKTMLKRLTALNRLNVIMLIAGIHKRFNNYLDKKVFQLNTADFRSGIQTDLQAQLDLIKAANPAGLTDGKVICDATNNTSDIIDTNQLIVDVLLQPTRTAEYITLRTTVQRTGADLSITNTVIGG